MSIVLLDYDINSVAQRIKINFDTKSYLRGLDVNYAIIKDVLAIYVKGLSDKKIPIFKSEDGKVAKKVVDYILSFSRYTKEQVYFILYELEQLAKQGVVSANKILLGKFEEEKKITDVFKPVYQPIAEPFKSGIGELKSILIILLVILVFVYFGDAISKILNKFVKEK